MPIERLPREMPPDLANNIASPFFTQGILGSVCVALVLFILKLWTEMKNERAAHKVELAAKDSLIEKLYDARISEARIGFEIIKANERSLDAFIFAVKGRRQDGSIPEFSTRNRKFLTRSSMIRHHCANVNRRKVNKGGQLLIKN